MESNVTAILTKQLGIEMKLFFCSKRNNKQGSKYSFKQSFECQYSITMERTERCEICNLRVLQFPLAILLFSLFSIKCQS